MAVIVDLTQTRCDSEERH